MASPRETCDRIRLWLANDALPLWAGAGRDHERGGFHEVLSFGGDPDLSRSKRFRVQCRQIYVYAHAHELGLMPDALTHARAGLDFIERFAWSAERDEGGWVHLFHPDGSVSDGRADTYDHAFAVLALAWLYRASGDAGAKAWLEKTLSFMETSLTHQVRGWKEGLPHHLPRRQNPHMHCFEAFMAAFEATQNDIFLQHARALYGLFTEHFLDSETGALLEYFEEDFLPVADVSSQRIEPGHQMEWVWLLREYARLTGENVDPYAERLYDIGRRYGCDSNSRLLIDELDSASEVLKPTMRCWPQTEYLKATLAQYLAHGEREMLMRSIDIVDRLFDLYLSGTVAGGWRDQFDNDASNLSTDMPASTFYHLFCAFAFAMKVYDAET